MDDTHRDLITPLDNHNRTLVANVHPADWQNPEPAEIYNLVAIGAGTAGLVATAGAAGLGAKVALIEKHLLGGDCLNVGCVPSKCIIRSSRVAAELKHAARWGLTATAATPDVSAVMERMRRIRARISTNDSAPRFAGLGVDVFLGAARFVGPDRLQVGDAILRFKKAVITTGARASVPPIEGLAYAGYHTNETIFSLTDCPEHLAVLGTGPIGCELAQAFARLGARVTIIGRSRFLGKEDPAAADILNTVFKDDGIDIVFGQTQRVVAHGHRKQIVVSTSDGERTVDCTDILVAVGRAPNVEGLGLEDAGVAYDNRHGVHVDDHMRTSNRHIFAAGDVCMTHKFTHAADFAARIVIQNALFAGRKKLSNLMIPWCTYTDPEIAHVGLYEHQAKKAGMDITAFTVDMDDVDRAIADGEERGFVKILVKAGSDQIVGATIVGAHAGDMISEISVAMAGKVGLGKLASVIHPYPTQAEAIRKAGDAYNRTRLTPRIKRLFAGWLSWQRK